MIRGTENEQLVLNDLMTKPFIHALFESGMIGMKDNNWIECSPDGIALIDPSKVGFSTRQLVAASVEIKTSDKNCSLQR